MHDWSEKDFDWEGLSAAGAMISEYLERHRVGCHWKEKYGTLRLTPYFFTGSLHSWVFPGYMYNNYDEKWQWELDCNLQVQEAINKACGDMIRKHQYKAYNKAYQRALAAYPHLEDEILANVAHYELLENGKEIQKRYWKTYGGSD